MCTLNGIFHYRVGFIFLFFVYEIPKNQKNANIVFFIDKMSKFYKIYCL